MGSWVKVKLQSLKERNVFLNQTIVFPICIAFEEAINPSREFEKVSLAVSGTKIERSKRESLIVWQGTSFGQQEEEKKEEEEEQEEEEQQQQE